MGLRIRFCAILAAGLLWGFGGAGLACKSQGQPVVSATKAELALPPTPAPASRPVFLWRAELGGSTFHLLGSVHVARAELYPLDPRIEAAFAESDALVLELALDEAAQLGAAQRMLELGQLEPGVRLADVVQPATWELLVETQERRGGSLFGLRGFRPWFVALALTTQALENEGFSAQHGIDEHFRRSAVGRKRIIALETVDEQLQLFTGLAADVQEHLLLQTLGDIDELGEQLDMAFRVWSGGDAEGLEQLLLGPMRDEYPALFTELFTLRNRRMLTKLQEMAKQPGRYFVVVGAGHLVGRDGIVDLLRSQGIVSRQL